MQSDKKFEEMFSLWFTSRFKRAPLCHAVTDDVHIKEAFYAGLSAAKKEVKTTRQELTTVRG